LTKLAKTEYKLIEMPDRDVEKVALLSKTVATLRSQLAEVEQRQSLTLTLENIRSIPVFKELRPSQRRFLIAYLSSNCNPRNAAIASGLRLWSHYQWKAQEPKYKEAVEYCDQVFGDFLEATMKSHAINGFTVPVHYKGELVDTYKEFNAQERITLLKGLKPQYKDNFFVNAGSGPTQINITYPKIEEIETPAIDVSSDKDKT
jgi:hypothetical protein